jgi:hypothetical protein
MARHGAVKKHGFAHHSEVRGANLEICYAVSLYKLAEQIVQTRLRIHAPSYYGIFRPVDFCFKSVRIDSRYQREDKQPDVIAETTDGEQFLIEFVFGYKVQHKEAPDYQNLNCLQIDISNQSQESLEAFLLSSDEDRKWLNNEAYFSRIEETYRARGKEVRLAEAEECATCPLRQDCCGVRCAGPDCVPLVIENSGREYRLCKPDVFERLKEAYERKQREMEEAAELRRQAREEKRRAAIPPGRNCFHCRYNLAWMNRNGFANCGSYRRRGVPKNTPPDTALECSGFQELEL